jgi:hypothetical protein
MAAGESGHRQRFVPEYQTRRRFPKRPCSSAS